MITITSALALLLITILCWVVSTLAAGGGAVLLLPLSSFFISLKVVIPALALGSFIGSLHRLYIYRRHIAWPILFYIIPGVTTGGLVGGWLFGQIQVEWISLLLGAFLILHVYRNSIKALKASFPMKDYYFFFAAFSTAIISSLVGAAGPIMNPFYLNSEIKKEDIIGTKACATSIMQLAKMGGYISFIALETQVSQLGLIIGLGTLIGNVLGKKALTKISDLHFKTIANTFLLVSATLMIIKFISTKSAL